MGKRFTEIANSAVSSYDHRDAKSTYQAKNPQNPEISGAAECRFFPYLEPDHPCTDLPNMALE